MSMEQMASPTADTDHVASAVNGRDGMTVGRAMEPADFQGKLHRLNWAIAAREAMILEPMSEAKTFSPGPTPDTVRAANGNVLALPAGWVLLPPGDPALTRRVKAAGDHWIVWEKKGRKVFSRGVCAAEATIELIRVELEIERSTKGHARRKEADARRREKAQAQYVEDFQQAAIEFLAFDASHAEAAARLARAVADHATPVGSGTVARTQRIPVEERAQAAVIAWMRHQTTGYDDMAIPRVRGKRREIRRMLAQRSQQLLQKYRRGEVIGEDCPLKKALEGKTGTP